MKHLSLFSGIGGFDLAAEWMGWENIGQVENDPFCTKVLNKNFPNVQKYSDIKDFPAANFTDRPDIITGGFPCQPFSQAGKRQGTNDNRHLWPQMLRVISTIKPTWVVAENVRGLLTIEQGMVFEQVCLDLEAIGYEVQPLVIPAIAVGAPHRRDRVWFIAYSEEKASRTNKSITNSDRKRHKWGECEEGQSTRYDNATQNTISERGSRGHENSRQILGIGQPEIKNERPSWESDWHEVATELCSVDDGLSVELGGFKLSKAGHRNAQIKAYGNAIVPQVAYEIFYYISQK